MLLFIDGINSANLTENTNSNVVSHREGWGTVWSSCVSVTRPFKATITIDMIITAYSDEEVKDDVLTITRHLKSEYQLEFEKAVSKASFKANVGWSWLGISASGEITSTNVDKYENGESGLKAAREEFAQLLNTHVNTESRLTATGSVQSDSNIKAEICLFFKLENVKFSDDTTLKIISDNKGTAETATPDGKKANGKIDSLKMEGF